MLKSSLEVREAFHIGQDCCSHTVFTQVTAWGAHLIFSSQRGGTYLREALVKYQKDTKMLSTCPFNQTVRTVIITEE